MQESFAQENEIGSTESSNIEFLFQLILVSVPVLAGIITSKWVVNSWQERKEKSEIKRKVLTDFENSFERDFELADIFYSLLMENYTNYSEVGGPSKNDFNPKLQIPFDHRLKEVKIILEDFKKLQKDLYQNRFTESTFTSSLNLYFGQTISEKELSLVKDQVDWLYLQVRKLVNSKTKEEFIQNSIDYDSLYNEVRITVKDFKEKLVYKNLNINSN